MRDAGLALIASGLSIGVVALVVLHLMPSGLSPLRNPVSQYGITRFKAGYRVQTLAYGLAGAGAGTGSFGLVERIFYLSMTAWLVIVAALLAAT